MSLQRVSLLGQYARVFLVLFFFAIGVGRGSCRRHRRIDCDRENRNRVFVFQLANQIDDLLRATDSECRNEHRCTALGGVVDYSRQCDFRILRIVQAIAVSRFDEEVVASRRRRWIANDRLIVVPQVTGKQNAQSAIVCAGMVHFQQHETRSENVACDPEARANSRRHFGRLTSVG